MGVPMRRPDPLVTSSDPSFDFSEAALARLTPAPPLLPRRPEAPQDNRALFIEAMADPSRRRIAFNVLEKNCRRRFAEGDDGIRLYLQTVSGQPTWVKPLMNLNTGSSRCSIKSV
jgi:hypothetical protein